MACLNPVRYPLATRLWCYRFALVQCDVRQHLDVARWGLTQACRELTTRSHPAWRRCLAALPPFKDNPNQVVLSPSLSALRAIRTRHPKQALVLLQTPYERLPPVSQLKQLVPEPRYPGLCHAGDARQPLRWLPRTPDSNGPRLEAYRRYGFPLHDLAQATIRRFPDCTVQAAENGLLQIQLSLLSGYQSEVEQPWRHKRRQFDALLRKEWETAPFPRLVVARTAARCALFRADVLRVLGARRMPIDLDTWRDQHPIPRNACFFADDAGLRYRNLNGLFLIHLDGDRRRIRYRAARTLATAGHRWTAGEPAQAVGFIRHRERLICLVATARGWALTTQTRIDGLPIIDQSERLRHLSRLFQWGETPTPVAAEFHERCG